MAFFTFHQVHGNCIERGKKSKVFLHVGNANQVSIGFPTWRSKWAQNWIFSENEHFSRPPEGGEIMAVFRIEKTRDYTVMANHHLRNTALSLKAKGLLSLMLSLPENWDYPNTFR